MSTRLPEEIIPDNDQTRARREHLEKIEALVGNAYPGAFARTSLTGSEEGEDTVSSVVAAFGKYAPEAGEGGRPTPEQLEAANSQLGGRRVRVAGRVATPPRVMGKAAFVHLSDGRARLQVYVRKQDARAVSNDSGQPVEEPESGWKLFQLLDHGDFVGVEGFLFVTRTGELSVHVEQLQFLSKALVPMPDKMHGINDPEIRQRQRYADLIASSLKVEREPGELTTREVFERRSKMITQMRRYLDDHGYVEVETPILSPIASGAAAKPFETYHNALDIKLYARIAPELYLKRLLVGGFERVYELNRNFRNEGISYKHNPEFTMLEFYCAYMDADGMMDFCEELLRKTVLEVTGGLQITYTGVPYPLIAFEERRPLEREITLDFSKFQRLTMKKAISQTISKYRHTISGRERDLIGEDIESWLSTGVNATILLDFLWWTRNEYINEAWGDDGNGNLVQLLSPEQDALLVEEQWKEINKSYANRSASNEKVGRDLLALFDDFVEDALEQPTFITDYPKVVSPLSKASPDNPAIAERFELFIARMECANGFSELNDPEEQYARFEEQVRQRERGDEEAMQMDVDYVRALSYGMPPAAGIGIGIDRIAMLLTNRRSIRDVILFPHMRPQRQAADDAEESEAPAAPQQIEKE